MPSVITKLVNESGPYVYYSSYEGKPEDHKRWYCGRIEQVCKQVGIEVRGTEDVKLVVEKLEDAVADMNPAEFVDLADKLTEQDPSPREELTFIEQVTDVREKRQSKHRLLHNFSDNDVARVGTEASSPQASQEGDQDLRVKRERDYSERVTQNRGHDPYTDEVKALYHNQCAFCGLKVEMPKGEIGENYALESAHIQRAADGGPDTLPNRVALCPFHHWAFDNGWLSLSDDHTVLVKEAPEYDGHDKLKSLHGEQILLPGDPADHPRPHFLQIHREKHGFID